MVELQSCHECGIRIGYRPKWWNTVNTPYAKSVRCTAYAWEKGILGPLPEKPYTGRTVKEGRFVEPEVTPTATGIGNLIPS